MQLFVFTEQDKDGVKKGKPNRKDLKTRPRKQRYCTADLALNFLIPTPMIATVSYCMKFESHLHRGRISPITRTTRKTVNINLQIYDLGAGGFCTNLTPFWMLSCSSGFSFSKPSLQKTNSACPSQYLKP